MRSGYPESLREDRANNHSAEVMPPRSQQPWIQAAEAVVDWYGAMFKLAFGFGRLNGTREPRSIPMPPAMPQLEQPESPPVAVVHPVANSPVQLRPKRRKSPPVAKRRSRSSKASSVRRSRRAA